MKSKTNIFKYIVIPLLLLPPIYLAYQILKPHNEVVEKLEIKQNEIKEEEIEIPIHKEMFVDIQGEKAYIAIPEGITKPDIVIYSHGSNTTVTDDTKDPFIKDLQLYGNKFTQNRYIFAASNQHGANWGNKAAIQDTYNMLNWIKDRYENSGNVFLIGFSMGGLPTMNFATTYPEGIQKIALLAPTTRSSEWNKSRVDKIKDISIQIWHGNKDVNVPYSLSTTYIKKLSTLSKDVTLITVEGKTHWDIDTEYIQEILDFFMAN